MSELAVGQYVRVRGRFHRSVHLAHDWKNRESVNAYLATPSIQNLALRIADSVSDSLGSRAWSLTGPFGSGKSAFAVFLTDILARRRPIHADARSVRRAARLRLAPLLPILVVGRRSSLSPALILALADAVRPINPGFANRLDESDYADAEDVWHLFEQASSLACAAGHGGLLVVIDEFGKFLEYASLHPSADDLFVLQRLAEGAARSPGRMLLLTIQHTAFADYLQSASQVQAAEWQKVEGRFTDEAFHLPAEQLLGLLGDSLETNWPSELDQAYADAIHSVVCSDVLAEAQRRVPIHALLPQCAPIDPITSLLLWPLFRSKMAQNERSLFAFLTSHEPHGFQEFIQTAMWSGGPPPLLRVDQLYDYVTTAIGSAALLGDRARHWAEVQHALDRLPADAPALAASTVKAIALIGFYGPSMGLKPTRQTLELALGDVAGTSEALDFLLLQSFAIHRRHQDDYALWEGSDVDLEASFNLARQRVNTGSLAERIERVVPPRPWVARAHYIKTGTLRYFDVSVVDGSVSTLHEALDRSSNLSRGDGTITFVLTGPTADRDALLSTAQEHTQPTSGKDRLCVIAFPTPQAGLEEAILELEAWRWINNNEPALGQDPVARREVRARVVAAEERLGKHIGQVLGLPGYPFDPAASEWIHAGVGQPLRTPREFSRWLSDLCDATFDKAPKLRNELLNRNQLSSAAAKARRNLMEAMILNEGIPRLGLEGSPPEATMYDAMLHAGGFHKVRDGRWAFSTPSSDWEPAWEAVQHFLLRTQEAPQSLSALMLLLHAPPYGLRSGPIPIFLLAILLARREEIALYEEGTFVPELRIENMERLLRKPESFSLRLFRPTAATRRALTVLSNTLIPASAGEKVDPQEHLIAIVKPLVVFAVQLVPYARQTRRFDDPAIVAVRQALLRAADPYALIFNDLPAVFDLSLETSEGTEEMARRLQEAIRALDGAYQSLLEEIETATREAFGLEGHGLDAAADLRRRAQSLVNYSADRRLNLLIREAVRQTSDWREGLGRVVADGIPPSNWKDGDVLTFHTRLQLLASDFIRLEELAAEQRLSEGATIVRVGVLNGQLEEARVLLTVPPEDEQAVDKYVEQLDRFFGNLDSTTEHRAIRVVALAKALARELAVQSSED